MGYYEMNVKIVKDIPKNKDKYDDIAYVDYGLIFLYNRYIMIIYVVLAKPSYSYAYIL